MNSGHARAAALRFDADDAGQRVAAVHHAVRLPQHLDAIDAGGGDLREVEPAADVVGDGAVDEHLVEVRVAAADEQRRRAAARAGLHDLRAGHQAQRFEHVGLVQRIEGRRIEHRDRGAGLRLRDFRRGGRDDHLLLERAHLQRDVDDVRGAGADVGLIRGVRLEAGQRGDDLVQTWCDTGERVGTIAATTVSRDWAPPVRVTVAPGTRAPSGSVTTPLTVACCWAPAGVAIAHASAANTLAARNCLSRFICTPGESLRNATILVIDLLTSPEEFLNSSSGLIRAGAVDCLEMSFLHRPQQVLVPSPAFPGSRLDRARYRPLRASSSA